MSACACVCLCLCNTVSVCLCVCVRVNALDQSAVPEFFQVQVSEFYVSLYSSAGGYVHASSDRANVGCRSATAGSAPLPSEKFSAEWCGDRLRLTALSTGLDLVGSAGTVRQGRVEGPVGTAGSVGARGWLSSPLVCVEWLRALYPIDVSLGSARESAVASVS